MSEESQLGPSDHGSVMLDIGGEIGALILLTPPSMLGDEIEISPVDVMDDGHSHHEHADHDHSHAEHSHTRTHVAVRERRGPGGTQYAAIFFGLREGDYTLWSIDGEPAATVGIIGGQVAQLDWR